MRVSHARSVARFFVFVASVVCACIGNSQLAEGGLLVVRHAPGDGEYASVEAALEAFIAGDTVEIRDNLSHSQVVIENDGVVLRSGTGFSPEIVGLVVNGATGTVLENLTLVAEGLVVQNRGEATVRNVTVRNVFADGMSGFAAINGSLVLEHCNSTGNPQGLWTGNGSTTTVVDCHFTGNGEGILADGGTLTVQGGSVSNNRGAGIWIRNTGVTCTGVAITGNEGRGVEIQGVVFPSNVLIDDCVIESNGDIGVVAFGSRVGVVDSSVGGNGGDGVSGSNGSAMTLSNLSVRGNLGVGVTVEGGSLVGDRLRLIENSNGVWVQNIPSPGVARLTNLIVAGNADGGIFAVGSTTRVVNATVTGNAAYGVLGSVGSQISVQNSILWQNGADDAAAQDGATVQVDWSLLTRESNLPGANRFVGDPMFADPQNGDFDLGFDSAAVDKGDSRAPGLPPTDFRGNPRSVGPCVDCGAFEVQTETTRSVGVALRQGVNLLYVPVRSDSLQRVSDLWDALGGEMDVTFIVGVGTDGRFRAYLADSSPGSSADLPLTDYVGLVVAMKQAKTVFFEGERLSGSIRLKPGVNLVGIPSWAVGVRFSELLESNPPVSLIIRYNQAAGRFTAFPTFDGTVSEGQAVVVVSSAAATFPMIALTHTAAARSEARAHESAVERVFPPPISDVPIRLLE